VLNHVICIRWVEGASEAAKQSVMDGLLGLREHIDTIRSMRMGPDLGIRVDNFDFASLIEFDDVEGYLTFRDHPAHQQVVREFIQPAMAERAGVVFTSP